MIGEKASRLACALTWVLARTRGGAKVWDADRGQTADTASVAIHYDWMTEPGYPYVVSMNGHPACYAVSVSEAIRLAVLTVEYTESGDMA